jgi:hypothetical protein
MPACSLLLMLAVDLSASVRFEYAQGREAQKVEAVVEPELRTELPFDLDLTAIARLRGDTVDVLEPGAPTQHERSLWNRRVLIGTQADFELRELYVRGRLDRVLFTVGKQQVVWGKADGLKVLDVVNPQDLREFILPPFEDSRIPLWTVNLEIPLDPVDLQLLWIPDPTFHDLAPPDGLYALTTPELFPPVPAGVVVRQPDRPGSFFADSAAGLRLSTFWRGWDVTLNYLYHYDDLPIPFLEGAEVRPGYERSHVLGGSFSNAFGDLTLRGELAVSLDRFFASRDPGDGDGVKEATQVSYVLGFDWYGLEDSLVSLQIFQNFLSRADTVRDDFETNVTLLLRRDLLHDTLTPEVAWIHNVDHGDGLLRPRVRYALSDLLDVWLGLDVFYGSKHGFFGEFNRNDRVVVGFELGL